MQQFREKGSIQAGENICPLPWAGMKKFKKEDAKSNLTSRDVLIAVVLLLIFPPNFVHARLYESTAEAKTRYGAPVTESGVIMLPLLKGTKELRYHHKGWRIRSAYVNDQAVIMSYMKLASQSTPEAVLQSDEIRAILKAEAGGYDWVAVKRGEKITNSEKYQGYFNSSTRVWESGNGSIAWISGNSALSVISQEGLNFERQVQVQKEARRKASITDF